MTNKRYREKLDQFLEKRATQVKLTEHQTMLRQARVRRHKRWVRKLLRLAKKHNG